MTVPNVHAGLLRFRIVIERPIREQDEYGQPTIDWVVVANRWADIEPLSKLENNVEIFKSDSVRGQSTLRIRMRYFDISQDMRIRYQNRIFNIHSIRNIRLRNRMTELIVIEESPNG